jgi:hypothetical protein
MINSLLTMDFAPSFRQLSGVLLKSGLGLFDTNKLVHIAQPPYGLDPAPSGFRIFDDRESSLAGCKCNEPDEFLEAVATILGGVSREKLDDAL